MMQMNMSHIRCAYPTPNALHNHRKPLQTKSWLGLAIGGITGCQMMTCSPWKTSPTKTPKRTTLPRPGQVHRRPAAWTGATPPRRRRINFFLRPFNNIKHTHIPFKYPARPPKDIMVMHGWIPRGVHRALHIACARTLFTCPPMYAYRNLANVAVRLDLISDNS